MMKDRNLKVTFNKSAQLYDEIRPGYPEELINDIIILSAIPRDGKILEIGCGTGQATAPFADRGYEMICLDIGRDLADIATKKFQNYTNVQIVVDSFEEWDSEEKAFDLVLSATAFHWIDPEIGYKKVASILSHSGSLAIFSNTHIRKNEGFFAETQEIYKRYTPSIFRQSHKSKKTKPVISNAGKFFKETIHKIYPWDAEYSANEYIKLLNTYSDHIALLEDERHRLFDRMREMIDTRYEGKIVKHYEAVLNLKKK